MSKDTGGPAFPIPIISQNQDTGETNIWQTEGGMTLRDYFAAKAMQALITQGACRHENNAALVLSAASYDMADAMLAERAK